MLLVALSLAGCTGDKARKCAEVYAGTIGIDGCQTDRDQLRSDGEFRDNDRHCRLWVVHNGKTGRCKSWVEE